MCSRRISTYRSPFTSDDCIQEAAQKMANTLVQICAGALTPRMVHLVGLVAVCGSVPKRVFCWFPLYYVVFSLEQLSRGVLINDK